MSGFTPRIGDVVLGQFARDWEMLARELHDLEMQKRNATTGSKDVSAMQKVEARVAKLADVFDRQRSLFESAFSGDWLTNPEVTRLRTTLHGISATIVKILKMGHPDRGQGSIAKVVEEFQKKAGFAEATVKASVGAKQPMISLPDVPPGVAANPVLAVAILIEVVRRLVLGKPKK